MSTIKLQDEIMGTRLVQSGEPFAINLLPLRAYAAASIKEAVRRLVQQKKLKPLDNGEYCIVRDLSGWVRKPWRTFPNSELRLKPRLGAL